MKTSFTFLLFAFFLTFGTKTNAQIDTLNYLKQFENNKANYIGKPLSHLLNDMTLLQPITVDSFTKIYQQDLTAFSDFRFCTLEEQSVKSNAYMIISWQNPISHSQAMSLSQQNKFSYTAAEASFYGNKIIKDIEVYYYINDN